MKRTHLIITLLITARAVAQWDSLEYATRDTNQVLYTTGFDFREGIYLGFEDLRTNRPAVLLKDLRTDQGKAVADLRQINGRLRYTDSTGTEQRIDLDRTWGFCNRNVVYVRIGDGFNRIGMMGSLAHLVYESTVQNWGVSDPMYGMGPTTTTVQEQRFLDMETGTFRPVDAGGIYPVIQRDPDLRREFDALPKKDRKSDIVVFNFMRRYNERHPLYFPR